MNRLAWWCVTIVVGAASTTLAQTSNEPRETLKQGKVLQAVRLKTAVVIDGRIDDEAWSTAGAATGFRQQEPANGQPMSEATAVRVLFDENYLYVAVRCDQRESSAIASGLMRRDALGSTTDEIAVHLDPRHDHLTGYAFQTNPSASQADFAWYNDDLQDRDYSAIWDVRTARVPGGWSAEFKIPFSQLRFAAPPGGGAHVWGFNVARVIRRTGESGAWVSRPREERGEVSLFGHLVFDEPLAAPRRLEIVPYAMAHAGPAADSEDGGAVSAGADIRLGVGRTATLAAAIYPDFGHVEQDPAMLNLSVFERYLPEKRAFFLEDSTVFVPPVAEFQLFYSRRIDETLRGAAKLTGKAGRWTFGALTAATSDASYNVARLQRDLSQGGSTVGGLVTAVVRGRDTGAYTGGVDYNLRWDEGRVRWDGHWAFTRSGDPAAAASGGGVTNVAFSRKHWEVFGHYDRFGREFRIEDLGFNEARADRQYVRGGVVLMNPDPSRGFRSAAASVTVAQGWTTDRLVFDRYLQTYAFLELRNFWKVAGVAKRRFDVLDDLDTRGGPPIAKPTYAYLGVMLNGDSRKRVTWNLAAGRETSAGGASSFNASGGVSAQVSDRWAGSIGASYYASRATAQWIENRETADGAVEHIYGALDQDVLDLTLRASYALTRDLTLEGYLQPFVAVGDYGAIGRLARPRSRDFEPTALAHDPDFSVTSLRGNVVLRWEYRPGSPLFVVWNLSQAAESQPGDFRPWRDLGAAFGATPSSTFLVKTSWWIAK